MTNHGGRGYVPSHSGYRRNSRDPCYLRCTAFDCCGTAANLVRETEKNKRRLKNKNYSEILIERGDAYAERTHLMPPPKENSLNS